MASNNSQMTVAQVQFVMHVIVQINITFIEHAFCAPSFNDLASTCTSLIEIFAIFVVLKPQLTLHHCGCSSCALVLADSNLPSSL